jgi:hypothetical protein
MQRSKSLHFFVLGQKSLHITKKYSVVFSKSSDAQFIAGKLYIFIK